MTIKDSLAGDVKTISSAIDPDSSETTEILIKDQEQTFYFTNHNGCKAAGNLYSTREKIAAGLGINPSELIDTISSAVSSPTDCVEINNPIFKKNNPEVDLLKLPIPRYYPKDGGRYISSGVIVAESNGIRNVSFHRMMIIDSDTIAVRLVPRHLYTMYNEAKEKGEELNIAICVGVPVEVLLAAATSTDYGQDEMEIASALRKAAGKPPLEMGRCDNGLLVPSDTDYVFEGRLTLEKTAEGPFVDITGTYDSVRQEPVIKIDKAWTCDDPILHLLLPGGWEHYLLMGLPREPMILKTVRQAVPRVKAVRLTEGGCCWFNGIVSISKNKEGDGVNAIMAAFTGHSSMKQVIVVDDDIDINDDKEVEWAVATRIQGDGIIKIPGAAGSSLDHSACETTWKIGYDATLPLDADKSRFLKAKIDE